MHETSDDFFYSIITFSYTKYFVHSFAVDVVFTLSYQKNVWPLKNTSENNLENSPKNKT